MTKKNNNADSDKCFSLEEKTIDNAKWFINGLNDRLKRFKIELVVKEIPS